EPSVKTDGAIWLRYCFVANDVPEPSNRTWMIGAALHALDGLEAPPSVRMVLQVIPESSNASARSVFVITGEPVNVQLAGRLATIATGASTTGTVTGFDVLLTAVSAPVIADWTGGSSVPMNPSRFVPLEDELGVIAGLAPCSANSVRPAPLPVPFVALF